MPEKKKILIIDDDEDICYLVKDLLSNEFEIETALNGTEGVSRLKQKPFDLVLLDIIMPGMNGYEVLNQIRKEIGNIQIIFLSAKDSTADMIIGFKKGAARYITKPIDTEELVHEIKTTLRVK